MLMLPGWWNWRGNEFWSKGGHFLFEPVRCYQPKMRIAICVAGYVTERNVSNSMECVKQWFCLSLPLPICMWVYGYIYELYMCVCCLTLICAQWKFRCGNTLVCNCCSYTNVENLAIIVIVFCCMYMYVCVCSYHCDHTHTHIQREVFSSWVTGSRRALGWGCSQAWNMWLWYRMVLWGSCDQCLWSWRVLVDLCFPCV